MEKKKLLKNKIVDTLPVLYLETVILMVLGQFLGNFVLGIPVGIAYARNPEKFVFFQEFHPFPTSLRQRELPGRMQKL